MRKVIACLLLAAFTLCATAPAFAEAEKGRGGVAGFFVGCCFGIRTASEWNEGKQLHFREWCRLIPYVNIVFAVWDSVDGAQGVTRSDLAETYGSTFY